DLRRGGQRRRPLDDRGHGRARRPAGHPHPQGLTRLPGGPFSAEPTQCAPPPTVEGRTFAFRRPSVRIRSGPTQVTSDFGVLRPRCSQVPVSSDSGTPLVEGPWTPRPGPGAPAPAP